MRYAGSKGAAIAALVLIVLAPIQSNAAGRSDRRLHTVEITSETAVDPNALCPAPAPDPIPDGQDIIVTIPPGPSFTVGEIPQSWWTKPPYGDPAWGLQLRGFMWVGSLAYRAYLDAQYQSLNSLVEQVLLFHQQDPDPGTSSAVTTANANAWGWDEGTALRRLDAESCLYALTQDSRLASVMADDVAVQFGPRFYGPPYRAIHNHGIMADLGVLRAADLLQRTDWQDQSIARLESEAPKAFTSLGTTREQSSSYHLFDVLLWFRVANTIQQYAPGDPAIASIRSIAQRADNVTAWFTEPDRLLTVFGDASRDAGKTRPSWTVRTFHDDSAGVAVGRWSWADNGTTYYVIRYGPPRWAHGQQERGGITAWSTWGRRVIINPGQIMYDAAGKFAAYTQGVYSHNVAYPDGRTLNTSAGVALTSTNFSKASWQYWTTTDALFGVKHVRLFGVANQTHLLTVKDTFASTTAFHQVWHLDPCWTLISRSSDTKTLVFRCGTRSVTMTTTGRGTSLSRGAMNPVGGWWIPDHTHAVPAYLVSIRATGTATTTWVVR